MQGKPQLLAWICCDGVHIDPSTGKHTLLGIFSNIKARQFPVTHPRMFWFLSVTDVAPGKHQLRISMGRGMDETKPLVQREFESTSPVQRINIINEIQRLTFREAGEYTIVIEVDDETILLTSIQVS